MKSCYLSPNVFSPISGNWREPLFEFWPIPPFNNNRLDIDIADEALKDIISNNTPRVITPTLIMEVVSNYYNIRIDDFKSKKRNRAISYPRQVAMYLCRELTDLSLPKIGRSLGTGSYYCHPCLR